MTTTALIFLIILLTFFIGSFVFFIIMDLKNHKKAKEHKNKEKTAKD